MFFSRPKTLGDLIKSGSLKKIQQRIDAANCNQPDEHGYAPLHYAVIYREAKIARYLLSQGSEPLIGEQGRHLPAINEVVNSLCLPLIEAFLDSGIFLPEYIDGLPLLHHLVRRKDLKEKHVAFFLQQGLDLNAIDTRASGKTVLAYYLSQEYITIDTLRLRWLISLGADVNRAEQPWATPLYCALTNGTLYNTQDKLSITTFTSVLDELEKGGLQHDLDLDSCHYFGIGLEALKRGHFAGFIRLLQAGISIPDDEKGEIVNFLTSENFRPKQVKLIFELNQSQGYELPLSILIHDSRTIRQIIDELPHDAPNINTLFIDIATATGLRRDEKLSLLSTLLDKGADINTPGAWSHFKISILHTVVGWPDDVEHSQALLPWLLERGAAIECHGLSAFYLAVWFGHMETANLLAMRGANLTWVDCKQGTVFSYLFTQNPHGERMRLSKVSAVLRRLQGIYRSKGQSLPLAEPFHYNQHDYAPLSTTHTLAACIALYDAEYFIPLARTLLDIGWPLNAAINDEHFNGNMIAYYLEYAKAGEDISLLLDTLPEPLDVTSEISGDPLQRAIGSRVSLETVQRLIVGNDPNRIIGRKIKGDSVVYVEQPLLIYTMDHVSGDRDKITPEYAYAVCNMLLSAGADPNCTSTRRFKPEFDHRNGVTRLENSALEWAIMQEYFDIFTLLLDHGADPARRACIKQEQFVHFACTRLSSKPESTIILYLDELERRGLLDIEARSGTEATPLLMAVSKCQTPLVRYLLDRGANPNAVGGFDNSAALHRALSNWGWVDKVSRRETVELLLAAGADCHWIDPDGDYPLMCAAGYGSLAGLEALLAHGADPRQANAQGRTALHEAIARAYSYDTYPDDEETEAEHSFDPVLKSEIVKRLLDHGADINAADEDGDTPLIFALRANRESIVHLLLERGADAQQPDKLGRTPLMLAAQYCAAPYFDLLWARQSTSNIRHQCANNGDNLLHAICLRRHSDTAEAQFRTALLHGEIAYQANDRRITPLHYACYLGHPAIVTLCCEQGFDVNAPDDGENTPLHTALFFDEGEVEEDDIIQMVTSLLTAGADPNRANAAGETPLMVASRRNLTDCVSLMSMITATAHGFGAAGQRLS